MKFLIVMTIAGNRLIWGGLRNRGKNGFQPFTFIFVSFQTYIYFADKCIHVPESQKDLPTGQDYNISH